MFTNIVNVALKQVLGQPFILMGLIVLIGYLAMKQKFSKALIGAAKASIGILVMGMGSGTLIANFNALITALQTSTGIQGCGLNTYPTMVEGFTKMDAILGAGQGATWGIYTMLVAFVINLILVALRKFTKIRAVYLTGNVMIVQCGISAYIVWRFLGLDMVSTVLVAALGTALYWGIFATLLIKPTHDVTGADFTVAHQQMFVSYLAYKIAPKLGNPEKDDIEKKKMPKFLNFMQDSIIATALVMFLSVVGIMVAIGGGGCDSLREAIGQKGLTNNLIFSLWMSLTLTANIVVLLSGVRMFVGEIMMSFKGISERLLPGAVAGVDCAALFAFAPKSVVFGLIFGALGQIIGLLGLVIFKFPLFIIPGFIPLFFDNATISIFANKCGGWKASALLCTINGIIQIFGSMLCLRMMNMTWWQGSADYATIWVAIVAIFKGIGALLGIPIAG